MANEARFYWTMMDRAVEMYRKSDNDMNILDTVQDECCKLVSEFRCPRLIQIEAWKLRSRCFPYDYWFAKHQLDCALEVVAKCEEADTIHRNFTQRDIDGLAKAKAEVEEELQDRTTVYQEWWKTVRGRDPPGEEEWYKLEEAQQIASGNVEIYQAGSGPYKGSDWPFPTRAVPLSALMGFTLPPRPRNKAPHPHDADFEEQATEEAQDIETEQAAFAWVDEMVIAKGGQQQRVIDADTKMEDAPPSPAESASEKGSEKPE